MVRGGTARDWSISGDEVSLVPQKHQCGWPLSFHIHNEDSVFVFVVHLLAWMTTMFYYSQV